MDVPPEIAFRNIEPTEALKALVQDGIDSLEKVHTRLVSCRVMVEEAKQAPHVRLDITVPGREIVVNTHDTPAGQASRELTAAIRNAFDVARRQLRERRVRRPSAAW